MTDAPPVRMRTWLLIAALASALGAVAACGFIDLIERTLP